MAFLKKRPIDVVRQRARTARHARTMINSFDRIHAQNSNNDSRLAVQTLAASHGVVKVRVRGLHGLRSLIDAFFNSIDALSCARTHARTHARGPARRSVQNANRETSAHTFGGTIRGHMVEPSKSFGSGSQHCAHTAHVRGDRILRDVKPWGSRRRDALRRPPTASA